MDGKTRRPHTPVKTTLLQDLFAHPETYAFVQVVRILHQAYGKEKKILDFVDDCVRIRPNLSLAFPPCDVANLQSLTEQTSKGKKEIFQITVNMIALYGTSSPMPTFYTEELLDEQREDRNAARDFLDILNNRFYSLFLWGTWFKYNAARAYTEQKNTQLQEQFFAFTGLADPIFRKNIAQAENLTSLSGLTTQFPHSKYGLEAFLAGRLQLTDVRIEECVLRMVPIPHDQQACLGTHILGENLLLGNVCEDITGKITIHIHNVSHDDLLDFLLNNKKLSLLHEAVCFYCIESLEYVVFLYPTPESVHGVQLGKKVGTYLGCDTWLIPEEQDKTSEHPCSFLPITLFNINTQEGKLYD